MPTPEFARELALEAEGWVDDGVVTREQADRLRLRYAALLSQPGRYRATATVGARAPAGVLSEFLYGLAGILLGAAAIVVLVVGLDVGEATTPFLVTGLLLMAGGAGLRFATTKAPLADAVLAAGLVPLTVAAFPDGGEYVLPFTLGAPLALLFWRRDATFLPSLAVVAFSVAAAASFFKLFEGTAEVPWLLAQLALLGGIVASDRLLRHRDSALAAGLAVAAFALAFVMFLDETDLATSSEASELVLGVVMLVVLGVGVAIRHRGLVVGAAAVVGIDAIVFAFDVGGVLLGVGILVALAGVLVWQAETLKRYFATAS